MTMKKVLFILLTVCLMASCSDPNKSSQLVLTTGEDVARTGEVFCDDPINPDVLTETPYEAALEWINSFQP